MAAMWASGCCMGRYARAGVGGLGRACGAPPLWREGWMNATGRAIWLGRRFRARVTVAAQRRILTGFPQAANHMMRHRRLSWPGSGCCPRRGGIVGEPGAHRGQSGTARVRCQSDASPSAPSFAQPCRWDLFAPGCRPYPSFAARSRPEPAAGPGFPRPRSSALVRARPPLINTTVPPGWVKSPSCTVKWGVPHLTGTPCRAWRSVSAPAVEIDPGR